MFESNWSLPARLWQRNRIVTKRAILVSLLFAGLSGSGLADSPLKETRTTLEKWVQTRQIISKAQSDWKSDQDTIQQTIQLFERELKATEEQLSKFSTNNTQIARERAEAASLKEDSEKGLAAAREFAGDLENDIKALAPRLPVPLQEIIKPLLNRMPADEKTRMTAAERLQVSVGILNELDKFNSAVSLFNEKRTNARGEEVAVETVYIGLGAAYFTNDSGDFAGIGVPSQETWEWQIKPELAKTVREVIQIYRNERPARFVSLPAVVR